MLLSQSGRKGNRIETYEISYWFILISAFFLSEIFFIKNSKAEIHGYSIHGKIRTT